MTHPMDEINDAVPGGVLYIQRECGCSAIVYLLEQRAHIEYCPIHDAALELLGVCKEILRDIEFSELGLDELRKQIRIAVDAAEGKP